jgi:hypothetical protein
MRTLCPKKKTDEHTQYFCLTPPPFLRSLGKAIFFFKKKKVTQKNPCCATLKKK